MATHTSRRGLSLLLSTSSSRGAPSSYRIRHFTSTPLSSAFASSPTYRAATTTAAKPAASTTAKPATSTTAKPAATTTSSSSSSPTTAAKPATSTSNYPTPKPPSPPQRTITPSFPAKDPPTPTTRSLAAETAIKGHRTLTSGLSDHPPEIEGMPAIDWTRSFHGLAGGAFTPEQQEILLSPIAADDVEVKPDGLLYLPEIKYRRILNRTFGPGGWGLAPRGETIVTARLVTREYGLVVQGRLVAIARGEQQYFDPDGIPTATEGCKSNALMRCCKDLGIASELWDPRFIRKFTVDMTKEVWVEHVTTKKKKKIVLRKDDSVRYPFKES